MSRSDVGRWLAMGVLLLAAPLCAAVHESRSTAAYLLEFGLDETPDKVGEKMGSPAQVAEFGANYFVWQFQLDVKDLHDFSHTFCFDRRSKSLISITRNSEEQNVDALFPAAETSVHYWPNPDRPQYGVRLRRLSGDRFLIAMGSPRPGLPTSQLVLIRRSAVQFFLPWLASQLEK